MFSCSVEISSQQAVVDILSASAQTAASEYQATICDIRRDARPSLSDRRDL